MCAIKKLSHMKIILYIFLIGFSCSLLIYMLCNGDKENDSWDVDDIYGNWKVTRVVYAAESGYGDFSLGNEIGRSFCILEETITDSKQHDEAMIEKRICYDMRIQGYEKNEFDVSDNEIAAEFNFRNNIVLSIAGITDTVIPEFTLYGDKEGAEDDPCYASFMRLFPYKNNNKNMLVMELPYGSYILERSARQEKTESLWGKWMVEELVSRGTGEREGIDFVEKYGNVYQFTDNRLAYRDGEYEVSYAKEIVDCKHYEKENSIEEGLGISNNKIVVFHVEINNRDNMEVIPVNENEIIAQIENQWFRLKRIKEYLGPAAPTEDILTGEWKPVLLIEMENVDTGLEALTYNNLFWWYGNCVKIDASWYSVEVSDWKIEKTRAGDFEERYSVPSNVMDMFTESDILHTAVREVNHVREVYIILDNERMIRGRNGLWFELEKLRKSNDI